jgi:histidine triad (HIT) family protein
MAEDTIFGKIIRKEIPAQIVYESETVLAFRDVNPQAPIHVLIVPKKPVRALSCAQAEDQKLLGELLLTAADLARSLGLAAEGYRVVINDGVKAGQSVFHLHLHLLGGRAFDWPPG